MKHFNLLKTMFLLCALIVGSNVWAADETITFSDLYNTNTVIDGVAISGSNFSITFQKREGGTATQYYTNGTAVRWYGGGTMTVTSATKMIEKIEIVYTQTANSVSTDVGTYSNGIWTGSASSVIFTQSGVVGQCRISSVAVTYAASSKPSAEVNASNITEMITGTSKADFYSGPVEGYDGELTFTSKDETIAKVEDGVLKAIAPGTTKITISADETENYAAVNVSFNVTVRNRDAVAPEGAGAGTGYTLVTDASTLADGDKLLMVGVTASEVTKAMGGQNTNNRAAVAVAVSGNSIAEKPADAQEITLEGTAGAWYFNVGDGYLYAASSSANQLKTETEKDDNNNAMAIISIDAETCRAEIVFQGTNSRNHLQFNSDGNGLFSCYSGLQQNVQLYRLNEATSFDTEIGEAGWKTIVTAVNVQVPDEVTAYIASVSDDKVQLTPVKKLKKGEPYILKGAEGTYKLTVVDEYDDPSGNELKVSAETDGNGVFVLAKKNDVVGFYKWTGGSLGAGRVFLPASVASAAREFLAFDEGETTGISAALIDNGQLIIDNSVFDLQGRRVAQPTKGLYIVNGKKVLLKNIK